MKRTHHYSAPGRPIAGDFAHRDHQRAKQTDEARKLATLILTTGRSLAEILEAEKPQPTGLVSDYAAAAA